MTEIAETSSNIVAQGTRMEGKICFDNLSRVHGTLVGEVSSTEGSTLVLSETALVEGSINADTLIVDGFVRGDITAKTRVVLSGTGRVIGNIKTPSLTIEFGAYFEGRSLMEDKPAAPGTG